MNSIHQYVVFLIIIAAGLIIRSQWKFELYLAIRDEQNK